jgi:NTE family protein
MSHSGKILIILFLITISPIVNYLNSQDSIRKPIVALVLSGGSAKGLAHIGVIQVLEEVGIKPDIIIGTSMGSIVGGLYSIGYTVEELKELSTNTDWFTYMSNDTDLRKINMDEKEDFEDFLYRIPFQSGKPELDKGVIYGHELNLFLSRLCFPANRYDDFNSFPIKFRAIASDVIKGEPVIFDRGPLSLAIRASMSLPSLFYPVEYQDKLLIDGGVTDNFGVEYALLEGADIIIGSNVGNSMYNEKELGSFSKIYSQLIMLNSKKKMDYFKDCTNVLIEPPTHDMSTRFDKAAEIIEIGYNEALKHKEELVQLLEYIDINKVNKNKKLPPRLRLVQIDDIEVNGITRIQKKYDIIAYARKNLKQHNSATVIENIINALYGTGQYAFISYFLQKQVDNKFKLILNFKEISSNILQVGFNYNNQSDMGLVLGLTSRNYLSPHSKLKVTGRISNFPGIDQYFTRFLFNKSGQALKQSFSYTYDELPIYSGSNKINEYSRNIISTGLSYMFIPDKKNMLEIGYMYKTKFLKKLYFDESDRFEKSTSYKNTASLSYNFNTLNDKFFPNRGNVIKLCLTYNFFNYMQLKNSGQTFLKNNPGNFPELYFSWKNYITINEKLIWDKEIFLEYSTLNIGYKIAFYDYSFGGVIPDNKYQISFYGLPNNYLVSSKKAIIRSGLRYALMNKVNLRAEINAAILDDWQEYFGGGLSVELNLPFAPLSIGVSSSLNYKYPVFHFNFGFFR